jgi:hypothetical protein
MTLTVWFRIQGNAAKLNKGGYLLIVVLVAYSAVLNLPVFFLIDYME